VGPRASRADGAARYRPEPLRDVSRRGDRAPMPRPPRASCPRCPAPMRGWLRPERVPRSRCSSPAATGRLGGCCTRCRTHCLRCSACSALGCGAWRHRACCDTPGITCYARINQDVRQPFLQLNVRGIVSIRVRCQIRGHRAPLSGVWHDSHDFERRTTRGSIARACGIFDIG
jgi:hypothetical protein